MLKECIFRVHVLGLVQKAVFAIEYDDVGEHGAGVQSQQLSPKSVPAFIH